MPATIGNIDLSRGQPPYNPNMGEYMVPANRSFTWESSPQEQGLLASAMGRSDLKELLNTGQWGPLAGQPYQYQDGRTTIGYGGGGGYPGGYPGGGLPPWQTGDYPPWQGQPPVQIPPPPITIGDPPPGVRPPPETITRPPTPFDTDPNKWSAPTAGGFVYDPNSVIPEFDQWSMWENQRIRDQNARIQRFQDPTSNINLNFAFEDAKRRGALPTTPLQDKAAFMDRTDANRGRQASVMPDDFGSGNPFADAQRRAAAIQAEQERARMGFATPFTPVRGLAEESARAGLDQRLAGRQDRLALEARQPFTPIQNPAQEAAAAQRMQQQQAAQAAEVNRVRALEQQRSQERAGALARQREQESDQRAEQAERNREQRQEASRREQQSQAEARGREQAARQKEANQRAQAQSRAQAASKAAASRAQAASRAAAARQTASRAASRQAASKAAAKAASQAAARARNKKSSASLKATMGDAAYAAYLRRGK